MQDFDEESEQQLLHYLNQLYTRAKELSLNEKDI